MDTLIASHHSDELVTDVVFPSDPSPVPGGYRVSPGQLVVFRLETSQRLRLFAFRTLAAGAAAGGALLPAVRPRVDLLLSTRTLLAASRVQNLLLYLRRKDIDANRLSDEFWLKLGVVLSGRLRNRNVLRDLLSHENLS